MNRTATEMQQAATEAQDQLTAANAQVAAARPPRSAANLDARARQQVLDAFNADTFTPQVWRSMGNFVLGIYQRYMVHGACDGQADAAGVQLRERHGLDLHQGFVHRARGGLLAADSLMADIQQFTYDLITANRGKKQLVKTSISLAQQLRLPVPDATRATGTMTFETTLDNFDSVFPGSYQGRIRSVSVDIQGIVPPRRHLGLANQRRHLLLPAAVGHRDTPANPSKMRIQNAGHADHLRLQPGQSAAT